MRPSLLIFFEISFCRIGLLRDRFLRDGSCGTVFVRLARRLFDTATLWRMTKIFN